MLIILVGFYVYAISLSFVLTIKNGLDSVCMLPVEMEECFDVNLFGRVLLSMIAILINPITAILRFLRWFFHVKFKE